VSEKEKNRSSKDHDKTKKERGGLFGLLFSSVSGAFKLTLRLIIKQIKSEISRFFGGLLSILIGVVFLIFFWISLSFVIVFALKTFLGLDYFYGGLIITGLNLLIAIILIVAGISEISKPAFSELHSLLDDDKE